MKSKTVLETQTYQPKSFLRILWRTLVLIIWNQPCRDQRIWQSWRSRWLIFWTPLQTRRADRACLNPARSLCAVFELKLFIVFNICYVLFVNISHKLLQFAIQVIWYFIRRCIKVQFHLTILKLLESILYVLVFIFYV